MTKVYTDDNFMYHNCLDVDIASWQNQLIDDYDLDYAPGDRPYIGATNGQISAAYRIADKKRRETVLDNLFSRKEKPQERICIDDATPEQWDAIDRATEKARREAALEAMTRDAEELDLYDDQIVRNLNAEAEKEKARDKMIGGEHYRQGGIQPIEYIHANSLSFCEGNVVKYITRWRHKDGLKDLEKAKHYIELLMELEDDY